MLQPGAGAQALDGESECLGRRLGLVGQHDVTVHDVRDHVLWERAGRLPQRRSRATGLVGRAQVRIEHAPEVICRGAMRPSGPRDDLQQPSGTCAARGRKEHIEPVAAAQRDELEPQAAGIGTGEIGE